MKRFDDATGTVERDRDNINTDEAVTVFGMSVKEGGNGVEDALRLWADNRFRRCTMTRRSADANFDADEHVTIERDEIEFAAPTIPVARDDPAPGLFERESSDSLAARPDRRIARRRLHHRAAIPVIPVGGSMRTSAASSG